MQATVKSQRLAQETGIETKKRTQINTNKPTPMSHNKLLTPGVPKPNSRQVKR